MACNKMLCKIRLFFYIIMALRSDITQNNKVFHHILLASNELPSVQQHCVWLQFCVACKDLYIVQNTLSGYRIVSGN